MIKCILHKLHIANTITIPSMKERDRLCQLYIYNISNIIFCLGCVRAKPTYLISFGLGMAGSVSGFLQSEDKGVQDAHQVQLPRRGVTRRLLSSFDCVRPSES